MYTPIYSVSADGLDVTSRFSGRNVSLTVVDATGVESDSAQFTFFDPTAEVSPPRRGAVLSISMGYRESGIVMMGHFKVDQVTFSGYPHKIEISAKAADNKKSLKERRTKDYTAKKFGAIVQEVAGRHGLSARVAGELASIEFPTFSSQESYVGQHEESDIALVTRLATQLGGFATVKQGNLVVVKKGEGKSVSGAAGVVLITPDRLIQSDAYRVQWKDKPVHGKTEASYFDRKKVKRVPVTADGDAAGAGEGGSDVTFRFREPFPSERQAKDAAAAKKAELARGEASASFTLWGDPTVRAEMQAVAQGIRSGVDGPWTITRVTHTMSADKEYSTKIESEVKPKGKEK